VHNAVANVLVMSLLLLAGTGCRRPGDTTATDRSAEPAPESEPASTDTSPMLERAKQGTARAEREMAEKVRALDQKVPNDEGKSEE